MVIFSEAINTVQSLARAVGKGLYVLITWYNRDEMEHTIEENFDANTKVSGRMTTMLSLTEVLVEGVNLHRANVILNYDTLNSTA